MSLSPFGTNFTQRQDIERRIPEVDQALQFLVRAFPLDYELVPQVEKFARNFVASLRQDDPRTPDERQEQSKDVGRTIRLYSSRYAFGRDIRAIYSDLSTTTPESRTQALLDLIAQAVATRPEYF